MKTVADEIADAVTHELAKHRAAINTDQDLVQVKITVKLDRGTRGIRAVAVNQESEKPWM